MYKYYTENIKTVPKDSVMVFGSNLRGIHGAGAARTAKQYFRAEQGVGVGFTGKCWALPTTDHNIETLPLVMIQGFVDLFITDAKKHKELEFLVTKVGCGLAGYEDVDIAPLFYLSPSNCVFHLDWKPYLE